MLMTWLFQPDLLTTSLLLGHLKRFDIYGCVLCFQHPVVANLHQIRLMLMVSAHDHDALKTHVTP